MIRFSTAGESHGRALIALIESFPAGYEISIDGIDTQLARRQKGYGRGARMKIEHDRARILSGVRHGISLGSPIACLIENRDWSAWENAMDPSGPTAKTKAAAETRKVVGPRPGHADLAGGVKYNTHDLRNVLERASARETAARVAGGAIARQLLNNHGIRIASHVIAVGSAHIKKRTYTFEDLLKSDDSSPVRCIDPAVSEKMMAQIDAAIKEKDTLGGIFEVRIAGVPVGLGSPAQWSSRLDAMLAAAMMSVQSVKAVEIGEGFDAGRRRGSKVHDRIHYDDRTASSSNKGFYRRTNAAGGIEGGMSNGEEIIIRAACKPISTLRQPLETVDIVTKSKADAQVERSDTCVVPAAAVVGEAMAAMILASAFTDKFGHDSRADIDAAYSAYLNREY
jgi:chorismate synthase